MVFRDSLLDRNCLCFVALALILYIATAYYSIDFVILANY